MSGNHDPVIILVEPQMGENIGMCARAMLNCGLTRLRLVNPRHGWPQEIARATAADADSVIDGAQVFETLEQAISDCHHVFATTARKRSQSTPVIEAESAAKVARGHLDHEEPVAILFGPEASGLDAGAISRADTLVRFPTNPDFSSLNLAQAVLLFGWEWRRAGKSPIEFEAAETVSRKELENFMNRLTDLLEDREFFLTEELKPHSLQTLRTFFSKAKPTPRELKLLHGVVTALSKDQ